jgi:hypothetical protein
MVIRGNAVNPRECKNVGKKKIEKRQDHQTGTSSEKENLCITPRWKKSQYTGLKNP